MLIQILGAVDVIAGLMLMFSFASIPSQVFYFFGVLLIAKSLLGMLRDFASWVDALSGAVLLLSIIVSIPKFIGILFGILLLQKALFSFVGEGD